MFLDVSLHFSIKKKQVWFLWALYMASGAVEDDDFGAPKAHEFDRCSLDGVGRDFGEEEV